MRPLLGERDRWPESPAVWNWSYWGMVGHSGSLWKLLMDQEPEDQMNGGVWFNGNGVYKLRADTA